MGDIIGTLNLYIFRKGAKVRKVNVTDLRQRLQGYLKRVQAGERIEITVHGKVVAKLMPAQGEAGEAAALLAKLRESAAIGDIVSPVDEDWEAEHDRV